MEFIDLLIESHIGLERQGPGSREATLKALSFIDASKVKKAADMGCGTGGQTIIIAENISGEIIGVDQFQGFVDVLNSNAAKANLNAKGMVGAMDNLPFAPEEFDLIWSEGAIDAIGFDKGLSHWKEFLKKGGFIAVTCPSWLAAEHPAEIENFWQDAGSKLDTIEHNISVMQASGYAFVSAFAIPEDCWTDNYFTPRDKAEKAMLAKYTGNKMVEDFIAGNKLEVDLYEKYKEHYGYVFYIGKKI